nr:hypothetical protein CFP56_69680 [Quercus suber]
MTKISAVPESGVCSKGPDVHVGTHHPAVLEVITFVGKACRTRYEHIQDQEDQDQNFRIKMAPAASMLRSPADPPALAASLFLLEEELS